MAGEDPIHALSPGIGHQTEEDGTIIQDHTAPIVVSDLMGHLFDQFFTEGGKNEENKESVTILDERFVGCNGKRGEATENESNSIDDHTVEQGTGWAREEAKDYNENEVEVSLVKTERFKNEVQSRRIAMEDEVQRRILDSLVNWFLPKEEIVDNKNKEEEEKEEDDKYSLHREFLLYIQNWRGSKETKVNNEEILEERFVGCNGKKGEAAESGVLMAGIDQGGFKNEDCKLNGANLIDDHIVKQGTGWAREVSSLESEDCKLNEANLIDDHIVKQGTGWAREVSSLESEVQSRRIAREAEVQRRLLDYMVNWFLREEELVDNENKEEEEEEEDDKYSLHMEILLSLDNGNVVSWVETESFKKEQVEEIPREMDAEMRADYQKCCGIAQQESNDLVLENVTVREEKVDNENEEMEGRIATDDYSEEKGNNEDEEEEDGVSLQRRVPDSIVNCHGCEEEKVDSEKEEEEGRDIHINEKVSEDASMLNQITKELDEIEFTLKNENDASAPGMIRDAAVHEHKSEEGVESREMESAGE
ncbi:uncharacterized protein LOC132170549 [Corylus avellana]|uniref:uncharacterized protein LOC132170549 n=1 Tax=Corylus avellana TaxID=13451 RepID=UPI00286BA8D6|nr:uncharacterized protein LOC132170549 [Corylus avellana]